MAVICVAEWAREICSCYQEESQILLTVDEIFGACQEVAYWSGTAEI